MKFTSSALFCALVALQDVDALRLGLRGWTRNTATSLRRRDNLSGLDDKSNMRYYTNLTLNGQAISALIDTGSSDLYVAGTIPGAKSTGKTASVTYAGGSVEGSVKTAALEFAGFSIPDQAYLEIPPSSSDAANTGLIGLGPHVGSSVYYALNKNSSGDPPLDRIFRQNTSTPNYLTVLLGRSDDPDEKFPGDLTVGELVPGYENITNQPKLAIADVVASDAGSQHWATLLDENGIVGPNGTIISLPKSQVAQPADSGKKLVAVFDSGFSLPQLPRSVVDAIYQDVPGAKFYNDTSVGPIYALPCNQEIDLTFYFGGQPYPIHPLDTNMDGSQLNLVDDNGNSVCIGAFQPVSFDASFGSGEAPDFDMILGMAWLRNAYLYVNMGDFIDGSNNTADPYLQLLSITNDTAKAHQDFIQARAGGNAAAANAEQALGKSSSKPTATSSKKKSLSKISKILIAVVIAGVLMLVLFGVLIWCCCCRNRGKRSANATAAYPGSSYQPLHVPAPDAATDAHGAAYTPQYNAPHATSYGSQEYTPYGSAPPLQGGYQTPYSKEY